MPASTKGHMGDAVAHESAKLHVTGSATYTDDILEPAGCLHAYALKSSHAHAKITHMDISKCWLPGVHAVMTAADIPGVNDVAPVFPGDPALADGEVFFAGQTVLAVAAESIELARKAARLAKVEYEALPAILDVITAKKQESFVGAPYEMKRGDVDHALSKAKHTLEGTLEIGGQDHFYLEGQIALATPQENGEFHCWSSTQHPSEVQHLIAKLLNIAEHAVTVEVRRMGGAFGGKESQASLIAGIASLLAWKTGRPVKYRMDRDDDMIITGKRHDFHMEYKIGFDADGRLEAMDVSHYVNCGFSPDLSNAIADRAMFHADNCYFVPNTKVTSYRCRTNKVSNTAFRGFGGPQGMLLIESLMDEIASKLGKDPLEVRRMNLYDQKGDLGARSTTHYGMKVEDNILPILLADLEESSDYHARRKKVDAFNEKSPILKKGLALTPVRFGISFTLTMLNQAGALVHVYKDGSVQLNHGGTEMGQGLHTKVAQVVANVFHLPVDQIRVTATNTSKVPNTSATAASSGSDLNGKAAEAAAKTIRNRLAEFAGKHFDIAPEQVEFENGKVFCGKKELSFKELVNLAYVHRISLSSTGYYATPKIHWDREAAKGRPFLYFAYGASVSEVIIDTLTGESKLLRTDILHDVGKSLNPALDIGQIEGGFVQGAGWLTSEELRWNEKGELKTHAPSTYKIPTGRDIADDFRVKLFENENQEDTIHRSKAVGEPPLMLANSVFLAIRDAVKAAKGGKAAPHLNAPATPESILKALGKI